MFPRTKPNSLAPRISVFIAVGKKMAGVISVGCYLQFATGAAAAADVDYSRDVLPILSAKCFLCHGPDAESREAELRLDLREEAVAERWDIPAITPGKPDESAIIARVAEEDPDMRMPPADSGAPLSPDEIKILRDWVAQGAEYSEHWAFLPVTRPAVPEVKDAARAQSPLDHFVLSRLDEEDLRPAAPASREAFIRRATLDVIGLPPTPEEVEAFVTDDSPDAYAKLIDRLLASPHYGERMGRHWLDVARYADSGGFETDIFFGHAWRYRDYVIRSFNADKPFDRFVKEQIAGDELFPDDADARIATGMYTIGPVLQEAGMVEGKLEYDLLTDAADATGAAFLGLTVGCARCHDHKYDPVSQRDYYRLQAIFAASDQHDFDEAGKSLRGGVALRKTIDQFKLEQVKARARRAKESQREEYLNEIGEFYIGQDRELQQRLDQSEAYYAYEGARLRYRQALGRAEDAAEDNGAENTAADEDSEDAAFTGASATESTAELDELLAEIGQQAMSLSGEGRQSRRGLRRLSREERTAYFIEQGRKNLDLSAPEGLIDDVDGFRQDIGERHLSTPSEIPVRALAHRGKPLEVRVLGRGELSAPGEKVEPGFPEKLERGPLPSKLPPEEWRSALAEWGACEENPLTARVIVNRVWQWHFGEGLVRTPNDFGIRGERPSHPELLDWLTAEFVENGWSLKHLHRTILLSSTYQMSSVADQETLARDAENRLLTRYQPHRLEAEPIWDSMRAVSGTLNREMFGLPIAPPLDEQEEIGNYKDWPTSTPDELNRRGIYLLTRRSFRFPMLSSFDLPDNAASCGRRDITTVPNQCLALLNNVTMHEQAAAFAIRLLNETSGDLAAVPMLAWKLAYARAITDDEQGQVMEYLTAREAEIAAETKGTGDRDVVDVPNPSAQRAVQELCLAIFNTNEFIYIQ